MSRPYPDEPVGPFERPPASFTDAHGREIEISVCDESEFAALKRMYVAFDPADRAQGIPPAGEAAIGEWLDVVLASGYDVVAYHGDTCVGHATLVADEDDTHELAIFVLDTHQGREGVERVWLTVERWNNAAIALYRKVGFETCDTESFEIEMAIRL
ncbi:MAG: GNAT family N-acetyltransferase [Halobacteriales archaeon SW_9_67_24]|nr:MAG: GNAT family N-acetyltransferase [Halobacteriales archaeon SW_9_67_24]